MEEPSSVIGIFGSIILLLVTFTLTVLADPIVLGLATATQEREPHHDQHAERNEAGQKRQDDGSSGARRGPYRFRPSPPSP